MDLRAIGWWRRRSGARVPAAGLESGVRPYSRAVLIAASTYDDARLPSIGAACTSVDALRGLLSDPRLGLWQPGQVTVIRDPGSVSDVTERIAELAVSAIGSMLLCYVGRGVLAASGRLYLAVGSTRLDHLESTAVAWDSLARLLRSCPAQVRRVILDCPVTGMPSAGQSLVDLTRLDGVYTLTATDLIGELVDLIHGGIPTKPAWLALTDIYPSLCEQRLARDRAIPEHSGTDSDPRFPFIANAAIGNAERAAILLRDAACAAHSIERPTDRAYAMADIAEALAPVDPEQAKHLAYALPSDPSKPEALARVARGLADLDRAERLASSITDEYGRAMAYAGIVRTLVLTRPDRAEQLAYEITDPYWRSCALLDVAEQLTAIDPDKAERVLDDAERTIRSMTSVGVRAMTLAAVARLWAARSPDRARRVLDDAVRLAYSIPDQHGRVLSLTNVVQAMAGMDPGRADDLLDDAEGLARSIADEGLVAAGLAFVVRALSAAAPSRAERLAYSITEKRSRVSALVSVAQRWTQDR